jgi:hypothetical protein
MYSQMVLEMDHWTNWAQCAEDLCSSVKPSQCKCDLSLEGTLYTVIDADNNAASLYILNITTVQSLQRITINVTEENLTVAQLFFVCSLDRAFSKLK